MACRVLVGHEAGDHTFEHCVFFCSQTETVVAGPLMGDYQQAEAFQNWLRPVDPREETDLQSKWDEFQPVYVARLCTKCDMYDIDTTGGVCDDCDGSD